MLCQDCQRPNPVWFAPSPLWNLVMGGPNAKDDPGGFICPGCFIIRAEAAGVKPTAWMVQPEITHETDATQGIIGMEDLRRHFHDHIRKLEAIATAEDGDEDRKTDAVKSLAAFCLLLDGWTPGGGGGEIIDLSAWRMAA